MKSKAILILFFIFTFISVKAAYFERLPYTIKQPDGKTIECFVSGDEFFNWIHDEKGYTIIQASDGYYYYAEPDGDLVKPSKYLVNSVDPAIVGLQIRAKISEKEYKRRYEAMFHYLKEENNGPSKAPHSGDLNNLVVYLRFSDDAEIDSTRQYFDNKFNPPTGVSLKSYYKEVSYDNLTINSTHYPSCSLTTNLSYQNSHPRNYYRPYNSSTNPIGYNGGANGAERTAREHQLLVDAINWINSNSPVSPSLNIDGDGDNKVDNVCFIVKGNSEGWNDILWAHRWALFSQVININGKRVYDYTFQPENQVTVTTICHEMFHALGAPDLYHYIGNGISPVAYWDLMEYGSGHMSAYMKWQYSNHTWISNVPEITTSGTYTLHPLTSSTNNCYKIASPNSADEYFMVEYRNKSGTFESNIPGSGLIVYRIDTRVSNGNMNGPPDEVYIYRPGGSTSANGNPFIANYSSDVSRTAINDATNPSCFLQTGGLGGLNISNVTSASTTISFDISFPPPCTSPTAQASLFTTSAITDNTITAGWTRGNGDAVLVVAKAGSAATALPVTGTSYTANSAFGSGSQIGSGNYVVYNGTGTTVNITSLGMGTAYYFSVYEYSSSNHCFTKPALTGNTTTTGHCAAGSLTTNPAGEYISNVTIGTINQASGRGNSGYQDFTSLSSDLAIGGSASATINCTNSYYGDQLMIWVDWNQNDDFTDPGENVYASNVFPFINPQITTNFSPPVGAALGLTRMRIRLDDADNGSNATPCGYGDWGEVEDYTINVLPPTNSNFSAAINHDWNTNGNWDLGVPSSNTNANIPTGKLAEVNSGNMQCNNLTIAPSAELSILASGNLKVNGNLNMQSDLNGTASLITYGTLSVTGTTTAERYIPKDNTWHLLSAPINNQTIIPEFAPTTPDLSFDFYKWDESTVITGNVWQNIRDINGAYVSGFTTFENGRGYLVAYSNSYTGTAIHHFSGDLNSGDQLIAVYNTSNTYNLIGNPYPSAIDWDAEGYTNRISCLKNTSPSIWIWNESKGNYGVYAFGAGTNDITGIIPPHQGFFVKAIASASFTIPNSARVHPTQNFMKTISTDLLRLKVKSTENSYGDEILIKKKKQENEGEGVEKWFSMLADAPALYSGKNNIKYSINSFTEISDQLFVSVGFVAGINGNYTISAEGIQAFGNILLEDLQTGIQQNLSIKNSYSFSAHQSDQQNRFLLHFNANNSINTNPIIYYNLQSISVINPWLGKTILNIYDIKGKIIRSFAIGTGSSNFNFKTSQGVYVFKMINNEHVFVKKEVIY